MSENEKNEKKGKKRLRGGSTITMQTAKNVYLWPGRDYVRKAFELYFSMLIEVFWSKERIMEVYLNVIEFGDVEVIAITDDDAETMKGFVERKNYPFRFYRINKRFSDMGINAIPVNYLINTKGQTVFDKVGSPDWTDDAFILKAKAMME